MLLQRLATGANGVKQARYRRRPTRGSEVLVSTCAVYTRGTLEYCCLFLARSTKYPLKSARGNSKPPASIFGKANRLCKLLVFLGRGGKQSSAFMLRV